MRRVLVANRGEIACRVIQSCRAVGLETVAVYSETDANALHVALADTAQALGGKSAKESYLRDDKIIAAARLAEADAIHPGYGFLAESPKFAEQVTAAGLVWIGPRAQTIEDMGDKERARQIAREVGVPVLPGSERFGVAHLAGLEHAAREVGLPLLVKAAAGGGGIGMRRVDEAAGLRTVVESTQGLAEKSFGDGTIYLERFVPRARHIEIQVFGYGDGQAAHLFERECSIQRRFQKVIEETPAPGLRDVIRQRMVAAAVALAQHVRYRSAGTVEFVVDTETNDFYFLEMNTRIQVEHRVTEMVTRCDLVGMQIQLARGELAPAPEGNIRSRGHAIECRIYAENPQLNFVPSPGRLSVYEIPTKPGVRIDTGVRAGDEITFHFDPMIAKVICHAEDRQSAIDRMRATLADIRIEGVMTNLAFLGRTVSHPAFRAGDVHTGFVEEHKGQLLGAAHAEGVGG